MDRYSKNNLVVDAKQIIIKAGDLLKEQMKTPFKVETKQNRKDLVTAVDKAVEKYIIDEVKKKYPDHQIISEEGQGVQATSIENKTTWFIDPIDGTMNFVHQQQFFAISIGIYHDGEGIIGLIYDVAGDTLYEAVKGGGAFKNGKPLRQLSDTRTLEDSLIGLNAHWATPNRRIEEHGIQQLIKDVKGTRSYGSATLEFAFIAEGILDGYISMRLAPWDIAAGLILLEEVGGKATRIDGEPLNILDVNTVLAANEVIHREFIKYLNEK